MAEEFNPEKEAEIVDNYRLDTLYTSREFRDGAGKFFTIVSQDGNNVPDVIDFEHPTPLKNKIKTTLTFLKKDGMITDISFKRFKYYKVKKWVEQPEEQITFSFGYFKKLIAHLQLLSELNLADISKRRIALADDPGFDPETSKQFSVLLARKDGPTIIKELIDSGVITSTDIVNIGYRKKQLEIFENLLTQPTYIDSYRAENDIKDLRPEISWQHFFKTNPWIFGYGLDYRYLGILQNEARTGSSDLVGRDGPINDFLLSCGKFTVLVEVKRPDTLLFAKDQNRANSWMLSTGLIGGVSQILEQKASWQVHAEVNAINNFDDGGNLISQRTVDPKSILIVGSSSQFAGDDKEMQIKARTFELFRRDSRNIEIVTYDELFERAKFIVDHKV